jgi:hypothetical protein
MRARKIAHFDMDAFYASVEQRDDPQLRAGSGERAADTLTRLAGYRRSPQGKTTTPNYSLNHARSGSDR